MPTPSITKAIKIFFSYATTAPKDKRLFEQLTTHLSMLRRQRLIDEWYDSAISPGNTITQSIEAHLNTADIIVLLISADFFASERCYELEMKQALTLSAAGIARLIPVILSPADWKIPPLDTYQALPIGGTPVSLHKHRDAALLEVAKGIRQVVEELINKAKEAIKGNTYPASPTSPLLNIPYRYNIFFTNRDTILTTLSTSFTSSHDSQTSILALNGLGGMGKTQIALEYVRRSSHLYPTILWLNASSRTVLSTEVSTLATQLSIPEAEREDEEQLFAAIQQWLRNQTKWLLVLDQIDDMTLVDLIVPPHSNGHVLLTTRRQALGTLATTVFITSMTTDDSARFLLHRAKFLPIKGDLAQISADNLQEARAIAQTMDGFPLALDQAGAYIDETRCSLAAYSLLYRQEHTTLLSKRGQLIDSHNHPDSVTITLLLIFEQVAQKQAANPDLLRLMAFLHPDVIPEELLTQGSPVLQEPLLSLMNRPLAFYQALADLRSFSLIHHNADRTILCIHRIVQAVLIDQLTPEQQHDWASLAVQLVNRVFPEVNFDTQIACERYLPQAQHCATLINDFHLTLQEGALLLERLSTYCYQQACYTDAEVYLIQALDLYEQHLGADSSDAAKVLNGLGLLYYRQALYQEAEEYHQRALALREQLLGPDHSLTMESLHNLAVLYSSQGQYPQAEQLYLRVLATDERTNEADDPETAKTLSNLGMIYYLQGHYSQAETSYQRALTIYEHSLHPDHPDMTYTLNSLGTLYAKRGQYQQAEALFQRALTLREQLFGDEHPETAHSMNKLADIYESQGKYEQAEALYQRALTIGEQALGPDHPDIALFLNNLAFLANKQEQYEQAKPLYQRALSIYEHVLGPEHPVIANVLNNLGQLARNTKHEERAEALLRQALAIREQVLEGPHLDTALSISNLADLLTDQHKYEEAMPLFQQALAIRLAVLGPEHPEVTRVQEKYASLLKRIHKNEEKAPHGEDAEGPIQEGPIPTQQSLDDH